MITEKDKETFLDHIDRKINELVAIKIRIKGLEDIWNTNKIELTSPYVFIHVTFLSV